MRTLLEMLVTGMRKGSLGLMLTLLLASGLRAQFHNGLDMAFGQQRVQYRTFDWQYLGGDPFEVQFYQGGRTLAEHALFSLLTDLPSCEADFQMRLGDDVQVLVYNKHADFRQSNIGIDGSDAGNIGGTTTIHGRKVFAWFDGDRSAFRRQLHTGLNRIMLRQFLYGEDWKDVVKNAQLYDLPGWMEDGMVGALSGPMMPEDIPLLEDLVARDGILSVQVLDREEARVAGEAVWHFILETFGRQAVVDVLSGFKAGRTLDAGFRRIGFDLEGILSAAQAQMLMRTLAPDAAEARPAQGGTVQLTTQPDRERKNHLGDLPHRAARKYTHQRFARSADGRWTAWATDERGQIRIWLSDGRRKRCLARYDHKLDRILDPTVPVLAWHPTAPILAHIHEAKGRVFLTTTDVESKESAERELFRIEKVIHLDWSPDGRSIAFGGVRAGQSDVHVFNTLAGSQVPLWEDPWDDLEPDWLPDGSGLVFSSNRPDGWDTLPPWPVPANRDLWVYRLEEKRFERLTDTPALDEVKPKALGGGRFAYRESQDLTTVSLAIQDSAILRVDTAIHYRYFTRTSPWLELDRPALSFSVQEGASQWGAHTLSRGRAVWTTADLPPIPGARSMAESGSDLPPSRRDGLDYLPDPNPVLLPGQVDFRNYTFESERNAPRAMPQAPSDQGPADPGRMASAAPMPDIPTPLPYRTNYAVDELLSQVDNTFATSFYQPFAGPASSFPGLSGLIKIGASDLHENRKWVGGVRLAGSLQNSTFVLSHQDLERKVDRQWIIERQGNERLNPDLDALTRTHTHAVHYRRTVPFSETMSLRAQLTYRLDRTALLATDPFNASRDDLYSQGIGGTLSWVFDDSRVRALNIRNGTRAKAWFEMLAPPDGDGDMLLVAGFDARRYIPLYQRVTLCLRAAGNSSFGDRQLIHYLGGVQQSLIPSIDGAMPLPDGEFAYQTAATPMRGFLRNARNGTSFAVANAELRLPIFATLMPKKTLTPLLEHFQVVGFFDIGSAWTGSDPYADENAFNSTTIEQYPVSITVDNNREPIIWDFGFGLRTELLGYFVRADWGWGVDDGLILDRVFQISLTTDF
jgi:hypothetical protein